MGKKVAKPKNEKKTKVAKVPKPEMVSLPKYVREHFDQIKAKEREVRELESVYETAKAEASAAKRQFEQADLALRNMIANGPDKQNKLPFPEPAAADKESPKLITRVRLMAPVATLDKGAEIDVEMVAGKPTFLLADPAGVDPPSTVVLIPGTYEAIAWADVVIVEENDAWRKAPTAELGLAPKLTELLPETIGELEDLRAGIANHKKEWPKGIGNGKVTLIEDAIIGWLTKHRETYGKPETTEA